MTPLRDRLTAAEPTGEYHRRLAAALAAQSPTVRQGGATPVAAPPAQPDSP